MQPRTDIKPMDIIGNFKKIDKKVKKYCRLEENTGKNEDLFFAGKYFFVT